jgi:CelD/BcsL family acetyltransferase involved in cellulose biosynthesis
LVERVPEAGPGHSWTVHRAYLEHLSPDPGRARVLALRDGEGVRALALLEPDEVRVLLSETPVWQLPVRMFDFPRDVVCPADAAEAVFLPRLREFAGSLPRSPKWLVFDRVVRDSALLRCLGAAPSCPAVVDHNGVSYRIDCREPFDDLLERLSSKFKRNLRYAERKLAGHDAVRFVRTSGGEERQAEWKRFLALEAAGWKGEDGSEGAMALKPKLAAFMHDATDAEGCEIFALHVGERCIASLVCLRAGAKMAALKMAHDEDFRPASPGHLILREALKTCCAAGDLDWLELGGDAHWSTPWRPEVTPLHTVYLPLGPLARVRAAALAARFRWVPRLRRFLRSTSDE